MELKEKTSLTREEAAARLHAIADELASNNDVVIERGDLRFVAHVPDQVHLKLEFEIEDDGTASIDLWCAALHAEATVGDGSIAIVAGAPSPAQCEPEQQSRDADLLAALGQVTSWRRSGDVIELVGPTPLRFRLMTN